MSAIGGWKRSSSYSYGSVISWASFLVVACGASPPLKLSVHAIQPAKGTTQEMVSRWRAQGARQCSLGRASNPWSEEVVQVVDVSSSQTVRVDAIASAVEASRAGFEGCFAEAVIDDNTASTSKWVVRFAVAPDGAVLWSQTDGATFRGESIERCITSRICSMHFDAVAANDVLVVHSWMRLVQREMRGDRLPLRPAPRAR